MTQYSASGRLFTISVSKNNTYMVLFAAGQTLDIANYSDADITVSDSGSFTNGAAKNNIIIGSNMVYNDLYLNKDAVYIKAGGDGNVSFVTKRK